MTATNRSLKPHMAPSTEPKQNQDSALRIQPTKGWTLLKLKELWEYRELLGIFVWRDLKVRYRQTIIGALWAIIQPLLTMVIFSIFFGRLAGVPSDNIPYPIFSYAALVPWTFFANSIILASNSLVMHSEMIKKIYFPRLTMPLSTILSSLVDFLLAFIVLLGMMFMYGFTPTLQILWFPFFLLLTIMTALGVSLWLSALNVQFRDVRYMVPFLMQAWFFATPIAYPSSLLDQPWRMLYGLNPMVGVVEGFRWALLNTGTAPDIMFFVSFLVSALLLITGLYYFRRTERIFADII